MTNFTSKNTAWLLTTLITVAIGGSGVGAVRPEIPEKGLEWANEHMSNQTYLACSGLGTDSADDELAWPNCVCQGELDCPAETTCHSREGTAPALDGDNVCVCHSFFGFIDDGEGTCEPGPMSSILVVIFFLMIIFVLAITLSYALVTVYQFIKVNALTINPATLTLFFVIMAAVFLVLLLLMYANICSGGDPDYWQNDTLKGPILGFFMCSAIAAAIQVLIMWIDVVSKSKNMTGNKKGGLAKLKIGLNGFIVFLLLLAIGLCAVGRPDVLAMVAFLMLFILMFVFGIYGGRLAKILHGDVSKPKSSSVVAIEHVAFRMPTSIFICLIGTGGYVALGKRESMAAIGFILLLMLTFNGATFLANVLVCYVRFGARKKLAKAGYCLTNPAEVKSGMTTTNTTTADPSPRESSLVPAGNQIAPMLKALNKFWAFGFQY